MYCYKCGQQIEDQATVCPYCGSKQKGGHGTQGSWSLFCVLGFALASISLLVDPYGFRALGGIILSVVGLVTCGKKGERGKGLAIAGIVVGAVSIVLSVIWFNYAMGQYDDFMGQYYDYYIEQFADFADDIMSGD